MTAPSASAAAWGLLGTEAAREGPGDFAQGRMAARPCRPGHRTQLRQSVEVVAPVPRLSQGLRPWAWGSGRTCVTPGNPSPARGAGPKGPTRARAPPCAARPERLHAAPAGPCLPFLPTPETRPPAGTQPAPLSVLVAKAADLARPSGRARDPAGPGGTLHGSHWALAQGRACGPRQARERPSSRLGLLRCRERPGAEAGLSPPPSRGEATRDRSRHGGNPRWQRARGPGDVAEPLGPAGPELHASGSFSYSNQ